MKAEIRLISLLNRFIDYPKVAFVVSIVLIQLIFILFTVSFAIYSPICFSSLTKVEEKPHFPSI